jgi:DNA-binding MarR family transcriptional regulator
MTVSASSNKSHPKKRGAKKASPVLDLGLLEDSLGYALRMASFVATQRFHKVMRPYQLRPAQFSTLVLIGANPGVRQRDLCETLGIEKANFVGLLDILERRNLVERRAEPKDRRRYAVFLTREGQALLRRASQTHAAMEKSLRKQLSIGERKSLLGALASLQ